MNIYVGNLPVSVTEEDLRNLFAEYGEIQSVKIITNRDTGESRGFGFIEMTDNAARTAITTLNGTEVEGKQITVNEARQKRDGGNRRGGGGGGGDRNKRRPW
jgi:RNA recognition motif-containing protein